MSEETTENPSVEDLQATISSLEGHIANLTEQMETLNYSLEIANERWVKAINENTQLEIQLRKSQKG